MRMLVSGLLAIGLTSNIAAAQCVRPGDYPAFDVTALKTKLMVTALTCSADDKYNAFITRYRPELASHDKTLNSFFSRANSRRARQQHDDYITQLANSQSQTGLSQGSLFCRYNLGTFDEVMALRSGAELTDFAAGKSILQPVVAPECAATSASAPAKRSRAHRRS